MTTASTTRLKLTDAGRQMREWELGLIQTIVEAPHLSIQQAEAWTGYRYADLKVMAERHGVSL